MFTGIVQGVGNISSATERGDVLTIEVELDNKLVDGLEIGASVAVDGVCLTAVEIDENFVKFDIIEETIRCTTLDKTRVDSLANIERSLKFGDEIGGHVVSGHVSSTATIENVSAGENGRTILFSCGEKEIGYLMDKGFVAIDGISLTVGKVDRETNTFDVHLIPETLAVTTISVKIVGERVNLELDSATVAAIETAKQRLANQN